MGFKVWLIVVGDMQGVRGASTTTKNLVLGMIMEVQQNRKTRLRGRVVVHAGILEGRRAVAGDGQQPQV